MQPSRRTFIQSTAAGALVVGGSSLASAAEAPTGSLLKPGATILFQGDSITDTGRKKDGPRKPNEHSTLGNGYAILAGSHLLTSSPDAGYKVHNRGISGNRVPELDARWDADCLDLKPDVLSILIGVNDIWHKLGGNYKGTSALYGEQYAALLERTKQALPNTKIVICEPFVLKCGHINDKWFPDFDGYRAEAKKVADKYADAWVPFQTMFDEAVKIAEPKYWAPDGVHPSWTGAALMANAWVEAVKNE